jgi:dTDP-4-dehydrorhamnose 3,5-epimerase
MHTFVDDRGRSMMSIFDHLGLPGQINVGVMYANVVKAWHRHAKQDDHWCVLSGNLKIGLFNTENKAITAELLVSGTASSTVLEIPANSGKAVFLGEHRPGVLRIPAGLWHGAVAVGGRDATLLYYVTNRYDPANPDEERFPWDGFVFTWGTEFK